MAKGTSVKRYLCLTCGKVIYYGKKVNDSMCECGNSIEVTGALHYGSGNYTDILLLRDDELVGKKKVSINDSLMKIMLRLNKANTGRPSTPSKILAWLDSTREKVRAFADVFGQDTVVIRQGPVMANECLAVDSEMTLAEIADE